MTYRTNSLPSKLLEFFAARPDEELTYADIVTKWGGSAANAQWAVGRLVETGELESVHVIRVPARGRAT